MRYEGMLAFIVSFIPSAKNEWTGRGGARVMSPMGRSVGNNNIIIIHNNNNAADSDIAT
jgi:hypothetical protein